MGEAKEQISAAERLRQVSSEEAETYDWWSAYLGARLYAIKCMTKLGKTDEEITEKLHMDLQHLKRIKLMNRIT